MDQVYPMLEREIAGIAAAGFPPAEVVGKLPREVQALCPRMRQVAAIVYLSGGATVKEVQAAISDAPTIFSIRTMLHRLSRRGILKSRKSGKHSSVLYFPGIITPQVRALLVRGLVHEHFEGSASAALGLLLQLKANDPRQTSR